MPLQKCPGCRMLLTPKEFGRGQCPQCGRTLQKPPQPVPQFRDFYMNPGSDSGRIAAAQKPLIGMTLFHIAAFTAPFIYRQLWPLLAVSLVLNVAVFVRLARALRRSLIPNVIALLLPGIALLCLLSMNAEATELLQAAGIRVGLFGAKTGDLQMLEFSTDIRR